MDRKRNGARGGPGPERTTLAPHASVRPTGSAHTQPAAPLPTGEGAAVNTEWGAAHRWERPPLSEASLCSQGRQGIQRAGLGQAPLRPRQRQWEKTTCESRSKGRCQAQMRPHSALCWRPRSLRPVPAAGEAPEQAPPEPPSAQQRPVRGRLRGALRTGLQAGHRTRRSRRRHARRFPERLDGTSRAAPRLGERSLCGAMHARREARFAS